MRENSWLSYTEEDDKNVEVLAQEYKEFLSKCKTERECTQYFIKEAESHGYQDLNKLIAQGNQMCIRDRYSILPLVLNRMSVYNFPSHNLFHRLHELS